MQLLRAIAASLVVAASALGQASNARYELALRLRELERQWVLNPDAAEHAPAIPDIKRAVQRFFGANLAGAAQALDDACAKLSGRRMAWAESLAISLDHKLCDASETKLGLVIERLYECADARHAVVGAQVIGDARERIEAVAAKPVGGRWIDLSGLANGDHPLHVELFDGDFETCERTLTLSIVEKREARLAALEQAIAELTDKSPRLERETSKALLALLKSLATGSTEETDYPGARLLGECEQIVAAATKGEAWYGPQHAAEFWLALPTGDKPSRVRVFVPSGLAREKPVPLVVALHGAGGSENMFFDTYGNGAIVRACEQRGWLLVAPRLALFGGAPLDAIVAAIGERYPVDVSRVLLVGHSMGAGAGIAAIVKSPAKFRAFAALGGGQGLKDASALAELSIFVGAGERDFGRGGAEKLHASLVAAGSKKTTLKIFPACEHLMVVANALPDVFRFFDATLAK